MRRDRRFLRLVVVAIAADETLVSLADDPGLASPAGVLSGLSGKTAGPGMTHLIMPALTTARTTAFMPALSPPEVRTASFILYLGGVEDIAVDDEDEQPRVKTSYG